MRTVLSYLVALIFILLFLFTLPHFLPGDPLELYYNDPVAEVGPELVKNLRERYGLDASVYKQVLTSIKDIFIGDLGYSLVEQEDVSSLIVKYGGRSLLLLLPAFILSAFIGFVSGMEAGAKKDTYLDHLGLFSFIGMGSIPPMVSGGILLYLFYYSLHPGGISLIPNHSVMEVFRYLFLPSLTIIASHITLNFLLIRNNVVFLLGEPFILSLRARDAGRMRIRYIHLARNIIALFTQRLGVSLGTLLTSGIIVEVVFQYPGLGSLLYKAILSRDYPLINGIILLLTLSVLGFNLAAELISKRLNVRG